MVGLVHVLFFGDAKNFTYAVLAIYSFCLRQRSSYWLWTESQDFLPLAVNAP